jgi:hypothetical protein
MGWVASGRESGVSMFCHKAANCLRSRLARAVSVLGCAGSMLASSSWVWQVVRDFRGAPFACGVLSVAVYHSVWHHMVC